MGTDWLTVSEVAKHWRVSNMTIHRLIQAGDLPATRIGRQLRIPAEAVADYERNHR